MPQNRFDKLESTVRYKTSIKSMQNYLKTKQTHFLASTITTTCRTTVEWGERQTHDGRRLVAGGGTSTGGYFEICK
jgi:hypothetical protein